MNKLDILFTSDEKYLTIMLASALSVIRNSNVKNLTIHLITTDLSIDGQKRLDNFTSKYSSSNVKIYKYVLNETKLEKYNIPKWRGTNIANARLVFNDTIQDKINSNKLLYLDSDTITVSNYDDLDKYKDESLCLVKDNRKLVDRRVVTLGHYYNSGVILIDINDWNRKHYQEKILEGIKYAQEYKFPDQDLINNALKGEITDLDYRFNVRPYAFMLEGKSLEKYYIKRDANIDEIKNAKENPVILHGCGLGGIKPWSNNTILPFNEAFMEFILDVDPDFDKIDLNRVQKIIDAYPFIAKNYLLLRNYLPESLNGLLASFSLKTQNDSNEKLYEKIYRK